MPTLIPQPSQANFHETVFNLLPTAEIVLNTTESEVFNIAALLAAALRPATRFELPIRAGKASQAGDIALMLEGNDPQLGAEGYTLEISPEKATLRAPTAAGLFYATQTLRQLFPIAIDCKDEQPNQTWQIACGQVRDQPNYAWRGMMLDVARHFFGVDALKHLIDLLAYHKINTLHLHLTDDQGWRIMIESWPWLALHGGSTATNGDPGGYYTQADYRAIVAYAQERYITVVPEIDMPGHTNAALASYDELNENGLAPNLYTGIKVGFSSLAIHKAITYQFIEDVVREIAALTPGKYLHIGGDETHSTSETDYITFIERIQEIVTKTGKQMIGWEEIGKTHLKPGTVAQFWWNRKVITQATDQGNSIIMSPANKAYMDIKYHEMTTLGLAWTKSYTEIKDAYEWDPASLIDGLPAESILGIESALWTETIFTQGNLDFMAFPRLCGYAEIGWTPPEKRNWDEYRGRLAKHGQRLQKMGIQFYHSSQIDWE